ncbi:MAG TPA: lytic transglycosylase domain-containing protein [Thermoanaerobaculaceae bacterium]|nr:lytic transglycosylase domain-containing protein [Thermoanaerobaculaceae bacterium]
MALTGGAARCQYLAVFVDGRILPVAGARLVDERQIRLDLGGGGAIVVPLARLDRVIADEVEVKPEPIAKPKCPPGFADEALPPRTPFAAEILAASREANLNPRLVAAVAEAESGFNPWAVSRVGAGGLMQLMPSVWIEERLANPYEPRSNLAGGCSHLRKLLDRFGDLALALAAYNAGGAVVERAHGMPDYRETRGFVRRVLGRFCPEGAGQKGTVPP